MLYLGYILLRFVDIVKSRSSFQFSLNISTSKCRGLKRSLYSKNCSFPLLSAIFSSSRELELLSISLEGSSYWESTVLAKCALMVLD